MNIEGFKVDADATFCQPAASHPDSIVLEEGRSSDWTEAWYIAHSRHSVTVVISVGHQTLMMAGHCLGTHCFSTTLVCAYHRLLR